MQALPIFLFLTVSVLFSFSTNLLAQDAQAVVVLEQPIEVTSIKEQNVIVLLVPTSLEQGESHDFDYIGVGQYRYVTLFVEVSTGNVLTGEAIAPAYELDAFFSMTPTVIKQEKYGGDTNWMLDHGVQEFGAYAIGSDGEITPQFEKLTTGITTSRALHSFVYGRYLRVRLKNHAEKAMNYRVLLFLRE